MTNDIQKKPLAEVTGPFYDASTLADWIGLTVDEIHKAADGNMFIWARAGDGSLAFPVWQFNDDGSVNPDLLSVANALHPDEPGVKDGWMALIWLTSVFPDRDKDGQTEPGYENLQELPVYQHLKNGDCVTDLMQEALHDAYQWTAP